MGKNVVLLTPPSHSHRTAEESLGVGYLASSMRHAGHHVVVVDGWLFNLSINGIVATASQTASVDLIGISCYISSIEDVRELISAIRSVLPTTPIVAGGYGPTFHPDKFLGAGCDFVLCGEGERSIIALLEGLGDASRLVDVPGLVYRDTEGKIRKNDRVVPIEELDEIPFPDRNSIQTTMALRNPVHISTSRGCMAHCLFCSVVSFGRTMRQSLSWRCRSISNIVEEIEYLHDEFGATCFKIVDDSFIEPPRDEVWAEAFANALHRRGLSIRFRTQVRADRLTPNLVASLADAGWFATSVGIENGSPTALKRMNKNATGEDNLRALELLAAHRIYVQMGMILFDHATTMKELLENFDFLKSLEWPVTKGIFTEMFAAEGTPFTRLLVRQDKVVSVQHGNYQYRHGIGSVGDVYHALKAWHRSHAATYDRAINPISAPKDLPREGYEAYHAVCLSLYRNDVALFGDLLRGAEQSRQLIAEIVSTRIRESVPYFERMRETLTMLDAKYGITYDASPNKFLQEDSYVPHSRISTRS